MIKMLMEQRSEQWFEARLGRITSTRFKTLMMGEGTKGYQDLIAEIASEIMFEESDSEVKMTDDMENGVIREPIARQEYERQMDCRVEEIGFIVPDEDHKFHEYLGSSVDGLVGSDGCIEIKCPRLSTHVRYMMGGWEKDYMPQVQGHLYVTGLDWCDFISYHPSAKIFINRVVPDFDMHKAFEDRLRKFIPKVSETILNYMTRF